jgi:hypothetical protein
VAIDHSTITPEILKDVPLREAVSTRSRVTRQPFSGPAIHTQNVPATPYSWTAWQTLAISFVLCV